jgi:hypothetical protein
MVASFLSFAFSLLHFAPIGGKLLRWMEKTVHFPQKAGSMVFSPFF